MLRYKTQIRPGLVTLYNIRPGNVAGLFLQPQSPHGSRDLETGVKGHSRSLKVVPFDRLCFLLVFISNFDHKMHRF